MKKQVVGVSILLFCLIGICFAETSQEVKGPKLIIVENSVNLGEVKEGTILEHTFKVQNPGDQPLQIERVKPG